MPSPPQSTKASKPAATESSQERQTALDSLLSTKSAGAGEGLPMFLRKKIAFREATHSESLRGLCKIDASTSSYTSYTSTKLSNKKRSIEETGLPASTSTTTAARDKKYGFTPASTDLFPASRLAPFLKWSRVRPVGPGLSNLGNTCFLNSVLQCLLYTQPLSEYLLAREHSRRCHIPKEEFCGLCAMEHLTQRVFSTREPSIRPLEIVGRLKAIGKQFRPGRQEDAHEFLRYLIESLQKSALSSSTHGLDHRSRETSLIHRIFGGYLQSTVKCASCQHVSRTFEAFLDLSLDVKHADSLQSALKQFTAPETLSKGNKYRCESCHRLTEAQKKFSIYSAPQILTVQLKRFFANPMTGQPGKLNRPITFPEQFDLAACMSDSEHGQSTTYKLAGVIVHEGSTCQSGHYHAFVRAPAGIWYSMNDCSVSRVGVESVFRQRAYILFYERIEAVSEQNEKKVKTEVSAVASAGVRTVAGMSTSASASNTTTSNTNTTTSNTTTNSTQVKKSRQERLAEAIELGRVSDINNYNTNADEEEEIPVLVPVSHPASQLPRSTSMWHVFDFERPAPVDLAARKGINGRARHLIENGWQVDVCKADEDKNKEKKLK